MTSRARARRPSRVAQQRVVVRDGGRAAARAGQRVGQQRDRGAARRTRPARRRAAGRARRGRRRARRAGGPPAPSRARRRVARAASAPRAAASPTAGRRRARRRPAPRRAAARRARAARAARSSGAPGPGRPSSAVQNARQASWRSQRIRSGVAGWSSTSRYHFAARPVELDLVDRLPGADVAQLGRAVGGEHEQRDARLVRLDHRGRVVGGGRARRAGERDRPPVALARPSAKKRAAALVDVRGRRGSAARGRARARAASSASPGEVHASRRPQRASSSANARRPR